MALDPNPQENGRFGAATTGGRTGIHVHVGYGKNQRIVLTRRTPLF